MPAFLAMEAATFASVQGMTKCAMSAPATPALANRSFSVAGTITDKKLAMLRHGLQLDRRQLRHAKVTLIGDQMLRFVLKEGRNRQIRRMCDLVDLRVVDLQRVRIGSLKLGDLPEGRWRPITAQERAELISPPAHPERLKTGR